MSIFFQHPATTEIYTLSLHDALPIFSAGHAAEAEAGHEIEGERQDLERQEDRSEEHTSELQSLRHLVCRLLLEKKNPHERHIAQRYPLAECTLGAVTFASRGVRPQI